MVDYGQVRGKQQATPSGTRSMTPTEKEVMTTAALTLIPLGRAVDAARLLFREGPKAVTKTFGQKTAKAVSDNKNKFLPVRDPASEASKNLITTGRYLDPKTGRFLTRSEAKLVQNSAKEGTPRKIRGVSTLRALSTAASMDKPKENSDSTARLKPLPDAKEVKQLPEPKPAPKPKAELVERKGPSYSDDMTQDDYGLREKVRIRDKAKEENIGEAAAEQNLKKGGAVTRKAKSSKYGMKAGGFTKRGGMYKKGMS